MPNNSLETCLHIMKWLEPTDMGQSESLDKNLPSVLCTELVSKDAKLPQCARQEAGCDPLWEDAVSSVTVVEFSETAMVSVEPIGSDLVLVECEAL